MLHAHVQRVRRGRLARAHCVYARVQLRTLTMQGMHGALPQSVLELDARCQSLSCHRLDQGFDSHSELKLANPRKRTSIKGPILDLPRRVSAD